MFLSFYVQVFPNYVWLWVRCNVGVYVAVRVSLTLLASQAHLVCLIDQGTPLQTHFTGTSISVF